VNAPLRCFGRPGQGDSSVIAAVFTDEEGGYWLHAIEYLSFDPAKLALPEGMEADPALMGKFGEAARALKLDRAGASRLIDLHAKAVQAQQAHQERQMSAWADEARAHYGDSLPETVAHLRSRIGDDADGRAFMKLMASTGLGSNVSVLRVLERLARGY